MSDIKHPELAEQGLREIEWAESQMSGLLKIRERFAKEQPLAGLRIGMCLHITKETAVLVKTLAAGGATVAITGCNPLSTKDDVAAALDKLGFQVFGWYAENTDEYYAIVQHVLDTKPHITIDDGMDLVAIAHSSRKDVLEGIRGGAEETTTGVLRLRNMARDGALRFPVIAVNDSQTKHLVDNYYGTGQSTLDGIIRATNLLLAGKSFVVAGYGDCGKGVAMRAKGMGANVIVTEVSAFRALQAHLDGFRVMPMKEAARIGDVFLTVTGDKSVITLDHMRLMKSGAIMANSGHFNVEVAADELAKAASSHRTLRKDLDEYVLGGKKLYLLAQGRLVNLAAAEGHPSAVMNFSFCDQALAVEYLVKHKLAPGVHELPVALDEQVAKLQLDSWGIEFDELTDEQKKYVTSWEEGT